MGKSIKIFPVEYGPNNGFNWRIPDNSYRDSNSKEESGPLNVLWYANPETSNVSKCKCNKEKQYNQSVLRYFLRGLSKSSISGVNSVVSAKNRLQRCVWLVVFACCFSGFGYQAFHFQSIYKKNPSVVQIEVENDGLAEFPAVTICNTNRLRKSEFCKYKPEKCADNENVTITEHEIGDIIYEILEQKRVERKRLLGHSKDMIHSCVFNGEPKVTNEECLENIKYSYDPDYGNCYTIPPTNKAGHILEAREADFWQEANDLTIVVDLEVNENLEVKRQPGLIVTVHDQKFVPDIHTDAVMIEAGLSYHLAIAKNTVLLLPLPYKTNCTDYESLPWDEDPTTRLTSRMCTVGCSQYYQQKDCNYVTKNLSLFFEKLPYDPSKVTPEQIECAQDVERKTQHYCRSVCGLPCRDTVFEITMSSTALSERELFEYDIHTWLERSWKDKMRNIALLKIYYSTLEHKIYRHLPKYNTLELFSYLGGYSGVWLGFSLLTVYELIEILMSTVHFAIQKHKRTVQQKVFLRSVFKTKKNKGAAAKVFKRRNIYK